jgi:Na+-driven multidrug efflux pump
MKYAGENGVAAYGVLMYISFIFISIFIGYSIGTAPIIGFHYGAKNTDELKSLLRKSVCLIGCTSILMVFIGIGLAKPLSSLFVGYDEALFEMTLKGFIIYSFSFLFCGFSIYASSFFTALNNGIVSAVISFLRTLLFQSLCVLILPIFFELDGVWFSVIVSETLAAILSASCIYAFRKKYNYL